jgi:basic membrane protein A
MSWIENNKPEMKRGIYNTPRNQRVLWTYTGTFSDITKGYLAAVPMYEKGAISVYNIAGPLGLGINSAVKDIAAREKLTRGPPFWIGVDADQDWINPSFIIASMMKRVDYGVYYTTRLVMENKFREAVAEYGNQIVLGVGTTVLGIPMEGISVSTLADLDEFIKMGVRAEEMTGEPVLPGPPEWIKEKATELRNAQPAWIWDAVKELESKIRTGEVEVPKVETIEMVNYWRAILG